MHPPAEPLTHIRDLARLGEAFDVVRATLRTVHLEDYLRACDMGLAIDICTMISARVQAFASSQTDRTGNEATSSSCRLTARQSAGADGHHDNVDHEKHDNVAEHDHKPLEDIGIKDAPKCDLSTQHHDQLHFKRL